MKERVKNWVQFNESNRDWIDDLASGDVDINVLKNELRELKKYKSSVDNYQYKHDKLVKYINDFEKKSNKNESIYKPIFNEIDKPLYKEPKSGKEHSLDYEDVNSEFSKYLRQNYNNIKLGNEDISIIRKEWKEMQMKKNI